MKVILCATKNKKLWHITKDRIKTYCGQGELDMLTDPVELPDDKELICPKCLAGLAQQ